MDRSDWRHATLGTRLFAFLALVCVIGGVVGINNFSRRAAEATGPHLMARNTAGDVLLASFRMLYLVPHGEGVQTLGVSELSLRGPVLSLSSDGTHWYLGDDATGLLHRCDLTARRCEPAVTPLRGTRVFRRAHRVAFTADRIHLTDTSGHQLKVFDRDGNFIAATRTAPVALCFPNGIVERQGVLYVADTNNFRIARLDPAAHYPSETFLHVAAGAPVTTPNCRFDSERFGEQGNALMNKAVDAATTLPRSARPPARADRVWPAAILNSTRGDWWVVQQNSAMRDGDVVIYDAAKQPMRRIGLPRDADPIDLIELDDAVLIADPTLTRVHRVALDGQRADTWQPPGLDREMQRMRETRWWMTLATQASRGALGLGVIAGIVVVFRELRRKRAEGGWPSRDGMTRPDVPPAPLNAPVVWISIDPARLKGQRRAMLALYVLPVLFLLAGAMMIFRLSSQPEVFRLVGPLWFLGFIVVSGLILLIAIQGRHVPYMRLGISEDCLQFDRGNGQIITSRWADIRVNRHRLLIDRYLVQMINPQQKTSWFVWEQVYTCLLPRIPPEGFVRGGRLEFEALRRGNREIWALAVMFMVALFMALNGETLERLIDRLSYLVN